MLLVYSKLRFANHDFRSNNAHVKLPPNLNSESLDRNPQLCGTTALASGEPEDGVRYQSLMWFSAAHRDCHPHEGVDALEYEKIEEGN